MTAYTPPGSTINAHKAIQADNSHISLVRKRCVCGVATTARQLAQYKVCPVCVKRDRINLLHAARGGV